MLPPSKRHLIVTTVAGSEDTSLPQLSPTNMGGTDSEMATESDSNIEQVECRTKGNGSIIKLIVGPNAHEIEVDEGLICSRCPFFLNALTGNFVESQTKTFTFPDDEPERFVDLCKWLETDCVQDCVENVQRDLTWIWLAKTWLFGEKYHIDYLQNAIIDAIHTKYAAHEEGINISFETLDFVAERTFPRSPLRGIFADMLVNGMSLEQLPSRLDSIPYEFLQDMCLALKTASCRNGPTNVSLLTNPISAYYTSSSSAKATAMPKSTGPPEEFTTDLYCHGRDCIGKEDAPPIIGTLHFCSSHNITLCDACRGTHRGHRKKMITIISKPYTTPITGPQTTIIDGQQNDSGFYCDGPLCDPDGSIRESFSFSSEHWALMSGDRYHCLQCENIDYCTLCMRGELTCKTLGHSMLRIRPTFSKKVPLTERIGIKVRQERTAEGACWRCGEKEHETKFCEASKPVLGDDVAVEN